jgi:hypothetical protein
MLELVGIMHALRKRILFTVRFRRTDGRRRSTLPVSTLIQSVVYYRLPKIPVA